MDSFWQSSLQPYTGWTKLLLLLLATCLNLQRTFLAANLIQLSKDSLAFVGVGRVHGIHVTLCPSLLLGMMLGFCEVAPMCLRNWLIRRYCRYCWCQRAHGVWWGYWQAMLRRCMQPLLRPWFDDRFYCFAADADCIAATVQIVESISLLAPRSCFFAVWTDFTTGEF